MATGNRFARDEKSRLRAALSLAGLAGDKKDRVRDPVKGPAQSGKKSGRSGFRGGAGVGPRIRYRGMSGVNPGYSRSRAWMGSSPAARRAGAKPKITPIRLAQRQATPMAGRE